MPQVRIKKGLIIVNTDEVHKSSNKRRDIKNIKGYHKLMMFEEICHLVEQKGDVNIFPNIINVFFREYSDYLKTLGKSPDVGLEIIRKLNGHRNHYEVYRMMAEGYPELFYTRWSKVFWNEGGYRNNYLLWKTRMNQKIALARLASDYIYRKILYTIICDYSSYGIQDNRVEETIIKCKRALTELDDILVDEKPELLTKLSKIDESVYHSRESFFTFVLSLWKDCDLL